MSEVYKKRKEEATVNVVSTIPGIGYVLDVEDVDFLVFAVASLSCDELQKMWEVLPTEHRSLVEVAMRERGCPVARR